jgi:dihydrofolate reductase
MREPAGAQVDLGAGVAEPAADVLDSVTSDQTRSTGAAIVVSRSIRSASWGSAFHIRPTDELASAPAFYDHPTAKEAPMTKVYTGASMSLDGYIAGPNGSGFDLLFEWYANGDVEVPTTRPDLTMHMTPVSAAHFKGLIDMTGALVVGRKLFDITSGWNGNHPMGVPVVVLTHSVPDGWPREGAPFTFVTEGIEAAVEQAKALAGDKVVGVNGGTIAQQCLDAGLLDEVWIDLVPALLGGGTPFFDQLAAAPVALDGPVSVQEGTGVTHLRYRVRR